MPTIFTRSGPGEILRAYQKDEHCCNEIRDVLSEIVLRIAGTSRYLQYRDLLNSAGNLLYYGMTTLSGLQTLGEEYTGVLMYDAVNRDIPTIQKRLLMILLSEFGQKLTATMLSKIEKSYYLQNENSPVTREARFQLIKSLAFMKVLGPFFQQLHRAAFYWTGSYYQFPKRILGIQYILIRFWLKHQNSLYGFKLLGIVTLLQTLIAGTTTAINYWKYAADEQIENLQTASESVTVSSDKRCPMCLDERKSTSLTPCGHLFCWYCIQEWLQKEQKCPVCRDRALPSRVVLLRNYA